MNLWKKIPFKKLVIKGAEALAQKLKPHVESKIDNAIDQGAEKLKNAVHQAVDKASGAGGTE